MNDTAFLQGKRILAVDDEPDILETLEEILDMCQFDSADNFEDAKAMIQQNTYDAAILDIMGVNGYELLLAANDRKLPAVILTSHALTMDYLVKFMRAGAQSFIPKDKMVDMPFFLFSAIGDREDDKQETAKTAAPQEDDVPQGRDNGDRVETAEQTQENAAPSGPGSKGWIGKLKSFYAKKFGPDWVEDYERKVG